MTSPDVIRAIAKERGQSYDQVAAEFGQPPAPEPAPLTPDASDAVDSAIATPVGLQADLAPVDAALAAPLGAQVEAPSVAATAEPAVAPVILPPPVTDEVLGAPAIGGRVDSATGALGAEQDAAAQVAGSAGAGESPVSAPTVRVASESEVFDDASGQSPAQPESLSPLSLQPSLTSAQSDLAQIERDTTGATMRLAEADEAAAKEREAASKKFLADFDADMAKGMSEIEAAREGLKRNQEELRAANEAVANLPPIRDSRRIDQKIWGALGIMLASVGDAMSVYGGGKGGGSTEVLNLIQNQVQRDIETQKANIDKKRSDAAAKQNEYGIARQLLGDSQQALRFATALRGERFAAEMEAQAATLKSKRARDEGILRSSELRMKFHESRNDLVKAEMGLENTLLQAVVMGQMTPQQAADALERMKGEKPVESHLKPGDTNVTATPDIDPVVAELQRTKTGRDQLEKTRPIVREVVALRGPTDRVRSLIRDKGVPDEITSAWQKGKVEVGAMLGQNWQSPDAIRFKNALNQALVQQGKALLGSLTEGDKETLRGLSLDMKQAQSKEQIEAALDGLDDFIGDLEKSGRAISPTAYDAAMREAQKNVSSGQSAPADTAKPTGKQGGGKKKPAVATSPSDFD